LLQPIFAARYLIEILNKILLDMGAADIANKPMVFNYQQEDYEKWVKRFGSHIKAETFENRVQYPENFATGYAMAKIIDDGLSYRVVNYTLNTDLEYRRLPVDDLQVMIYFYELNFEGTVYCKTGKTVIEASDKYYSVALMTNSLTHQNLILKKGTSVKGLSIQITAGWLKNNITHLTPEKLAFIMQKECVLDFITAKQRKILSNIYENAAESHLPDLFIKSRVLRLTEQFLDNLCNRGISEMPASTNQKDFQALVKVEHILTQKYNEGFPSIELLAKTAYMSESKLKNLFKKAYGMAIYQYYQKNRMHKAKEFLKAQKHSVSQVGTMLGYQNLSNFSVAFKKEFSFLPSEYHEVV
jgi:AraC-like DNA-binding protein